MDKILQSMSEGGKVTITNDGATILKSIPIDNAAAKILVDISKTQDAEVGDGTTSVVVLAVEFLREAEKLINQKIHPQTVIRGYRKALEVARAALEASAVDNGKDEAKFREDLMNIARTTLSSKILHVDKDKFAALAVDAVMRLRGSTNLDSIHIVKKVGVSLISLVVLVSGLGLHLSSFFVLACVQNMCCGLASSFPPYIYLSPPCERRSAAR